MSYSFVESSANNQTLEETQLVLTYELGRIFNCLYNVRDLVGYDTFGRTEMSDFISMMRMLCEQKSWNYELLMKEATSLPSRYDYNGVLAKMMIALGKLIRGLHYVKRFNDPRGDDPLIAIVELLRWSRQLCLSLHWDYWQLQDLGELRYEERMQDLRANGISTGLKLEYRRINE